MVKTPQELEAKHRRFLADRSLRAGDPIQEPWLAAEPLIARVNDGCWIGDCGCNNGVAIEPTWSEARCFGCGAVYTQVVLPDEETRLNAEFILARRRKRNQHWTTETLLELAIENAEHGDRF